MTPKSDDTGRSGTLPLPELNPLLNPLLNKNLGRWAEVYFTNPPDKREEAVVHLLRELEGGAGAAAVTHPAPLKASPARNAAFATRRNAALCYQCGFENEPLQKFCGDCGAQLSGPPMGATAILSQFREPKRDNPAKLERASEVLEAAPQFGSILHLSDPVPERPFTYETMQGDPQAESSQLLFGEATQTAALKSSYRVYIALVLAAIIGGLGYMAWRGGQSKPDGSIYPAQAPPAATQPARTPAPVANSAPPDTTSLRPAARSNPEANPITSVSPGERPQRPQNAAKTESLPVQKPPASPNGSSTPSVNGGQELATALNFLNGVGEQRDTAAAAQWLWKAVEKQNTAATVLLAGLYLRGDGVQKNCDQGRVLLDAAANKGNKDAADLLRNMQAFGCE